MDIDKIFTLFDYKNENKPLNEEDNAIIELYEKPLFWVGMFEKLIQNNNTFKQQIGKILKNDPHYDFDALNEAGDYIVYNRAYMFLSLINMDDENHKQAIKARTKHSYLIISLITSINYFSSIEEYEKCAVLKKILDFAKESLETQEKDRNF